MVNAHTQRLLVWCAPCGFVILLIALIAASWLPLPSPDHSAEYVARSYQEDKNGIRLGAILLTLGAALIAPLSAVLATQIRRIEGENHPLAYLEVAIGCGAMVAVTITSFFWWTAAFRPERDPVVTQSWHDAGWLCFTATVFLFMLQLLVVAMAAMNDRREEPILPRWSGYLSAWCALLLVPSTLCLWFKTGPLAWNGVLSLYLAFVGVGIWMVTMIVLLLRAIKRQDEASSALIET